jgi:hypothetical protein
MPSRKHFAGWLTPFRCLVRFNYRSRFKSGASMKQALYLIALTAISAGCHADGLGSLAEISVVDCDSGAVLPSHFYRGEYWVAGTPGARYAIAVRNRTGGRVLAVASVDGINVLSGATAGWGQTGYVFGAGEQYQISGWRKSDDEVAAFTFTASANSYAERTGRAANIGVIGVAIFKEREHSPVRQYAAPPTEPSFADLSSSRASAGKPFSPNDNSAKSPPSFGASELIAGTFSSEPAAATAAPKLGTGHGEREFSHVDHTAFERLQSQPNEVFLLHYDSMENLLAMGVITRPRRSPGNPFPASPGLGYVPDPPG